MFSLKKNNFIDDINDEKLMEFLKQNILVVKYIYKKIEW